MAEVVETSAAMRGSAELMVESLAQGRAFLDTVRGAWRSPELESWAEELTHMQMAPAYPVSIAVVCAMNQIPLESGLSAYLHAFAASLVSAGIRLIPLGQMDGQKVMAALEAPVITATQVALECPLEDLGAATPMVDWTSMQHETQYTRLFRS
jgi:urease accessory protein